MQGVTLSEQEQSRLKVLNSVVVGRLLVSQAAEGPRKPTPRQTALWEEVQEARARGLPLRGISREPKIHRQTARKYALAESPPVHARPHIATALSDIIENQGNGHFR